MNDKLVFLGLLYFVQGIPYGLQSSLLPVYLRGAGHSLTRIGFTKILYFPWVLKVLWAPLVDRVGTKRRWLVGTVSGLALTCLSSAALAPEAHIWGVAGTLLAMNTFASVQDIAVDGAAVGLLKGRGELGLGNTAQVVGYKAGSVFAGGGLLAVIDVAGWSWMFMLLTFVYAGVALFVWGAPVLDDESIKQADGSRRGGQGAEAMRPWRIWRKLMAVPGTPWTILYVLTYKLELPSGDFVLLLEDFNADGETKVLAEEKCLGFVIVSSDLQHSIVALGVEGDSLGCPLSPILFVVFMDRILRSVVMRKIIVNLQCFLFSLRLHLKDGKTKHTCLSEGERPI
ncbi:hypothetical protein CCH79_00006914 [Gambusia affinis]|uniref:Major facilitator superfamily (MFS) profile domain-containing protein n=1 Tax=Gambusia affinis TaxID=33528 RepID=A0A315V9M8_GAMAF|nr:hypothetical protein CCH79_00006914 [Gambusia affinis]